MAKVPCYLAPIYNFFLILFINYLIIASEAQSVPEFSSLELKKIELSVDNADYKTVLFEVRGSNIKKGLRIKATKTLSEKNSPCKDTLSDYNVSERWTQNFNQASYFLTVPKNLTGKVYLCLPHNEIRTSQDHIPSSIGDSELFKWYHQGENVYVQIPSENAKEIFNIQTQRDRRAEEIPENQFKIFGLRLEFPANDKELELDGGIPVLMAHSEEYLRLFGLNLQDDLTITFTPESGSFGEICQLPVVKGFSVNGSELSGNTILVNVKLPPMPEDATCLYICVKKGGYSSNAPFIHQGSETWLRVMVKEPLLPVWSAIAIILLCLSFSALFSGLNLGLMSLDMTELKILCNTGSSKEQKYAKAISPVRAHGNYLLCSILLGNVFVNNIFTILLDSLTSGPVAVLGSTLAIVTFGEITPQAICSRYGLAIGARTIHITKFVMILTFPLSYPVSKFLDWLLGEEIGNYYNRERLNELVKVTTGVNDLDKDEVNIISGALELRKKSVADVMTKIEDVFMLDYEAVLDFETVSEIMKSGFSRIPVFEGNRQNIVTMLYIKDLAFVDPDDNTPLKTLCQFYQNPCNFVFEDVTLDVMFKIFKEGNKGHMAFVHRVNNEGEGDPFYETIGLITLEDVIEELIQAEIMDETDVFTDNRSKRKRIGKAKPDFSIFAERRGESNKVRISPQLTLAAYQFLSTTIESFHPNVISEIILRRLLQQDIYCLIKKNKAWKTDPGNVIYQQGKNSDYFVLILEGRVEVTVGKENLTFEGGPFTYFGIQALVQTIGVAESPSMPTSTLGSLESLNIDALLKHSFQPDYTVRACSEVLYMLIKRSLYLAAKRATLMERSQRDNQTGEQFDEEVDKLLHSLDDGGSSIGQSTPRKHSKQHHEGHDYASKNTSPRSPLYLNSSTPHHVSPKEINGRVMSNNDVSCDMQEKEEEVSLLPRKS